ncbi:hypothetical protein DMUE_4885 [Dictyocoela muelleri]|nr:hypothetical protein DMUE_4885 [Dictyocoela muelleri]
MFTNLIGDNIDEKEKNSKMVDCYENSTFVQSNNNFIDNFIDYNISKESTSEDAIQLKNSITSLDAHNMLVDLEVWFGENKSEGIKYILKLKELLLEEKRDRHENIKDFLNWKR